MSLLEPPPDVHKKSRAMIFTMTAAFIIAIIAVWFWLRFYPEKKAAEQFFNAVVAGDMNTAYQLWKPGPGSSYKLQDFIAAWGPPALVNPLTHAPILAD